MNFEIASVITHEPRAEYYCLAEFHKSLHRYGHEVKVINYPGTWGGLLSKAKWLKKAILENALTGKIIIFCDSYDLVFADDPKHIVAAFENFDVPFICSAERNCFPLTHQAAFDALNPPTSYKYLNSGFIVAYRDALLAVLEAMDLENQPDDHEIDGKMWHNTDGERYHEQFIAQPVKMILDYQQLFSQTMCEVNEGELDFSQARIKNIETGAYPMSFHFNGYSKDKWSRTPILKHLEL